MRRRAGAGVARAWQRFVEKPDARDRAGLSRRGRLLLEQRHVPVPRVALPAGTASASAPTSSRRRARRWRSGAARRRLHPPGPRRVRRVPVGFDRLRGDGDAPTRAHGAAGGHRLERRRLVVGAVGRAEQDGDGNAHARRRDRASTAATATRMRGGWWRWSASTTWSWSIPTTRCWSRARTGCSRSRTSSRGSSASSAARPRCIAKCTGRGAATTRSTSATRFQVKRIKVKPGARLSLQIAHAPRRALDRGARHRAGDPRQRRVRTARQPVHLHSDRRETPAGESRHARCWN